jgi:hypothetical protein
MKIIFLDIDGVMSTAQCWGKGSDNEWGAYMFDPKCVKVLNEILKETDADIILSSDWKHHYTLHEMKCIFTHNKVIKGPVGFTPALPTNGMDLEGGRVNEIKLWIKNNAWKNDTKWVAIDDMNMSETFDVNGETTGGLTNFVHCKRVMEGLKQLGLKDKVINFLK